MKQLKLIALFISLIAVCNVNAQQKLQKVSKSVKANNDVTLKLNTNHTNIEVESWDKNEIQIEAYIESNELSKKDLQKILDRWKLNVEGSGDNVTISTGGDVHVLYGEDFDFDFDFDPEIQEAMKDLKIRLSDLNINIPNIDLSKFNVNMPEFPELPEFPEFPELPNLPEGIHSFSFDYDAYEKDGDAYLKKWKKEYEKKHGTKYSDEVEAWAKKFSESDYKEWAKKMEKWGEEYGKKFEGKWAKDMEKWGENFGEELENSDWIKDIEKWADKFGESFGKDMEAWAEDFAEQFDDENGDFQKRIREIEKKADDFEENSKNKSKVIKTIKIKMPKDTKLKMNVRHGELKFASTVYNLKADLAHSKLLATRIDGSETSIDAAYSIINIDDWNQGELKLKYGEYTQLKNVNRLRLNANSSDIIVGKLSGNAIISGSFGDLEIENIANTFNNLNLVLENTDAIVKLPKTNYNLEYQGNRSRFSHPEKKSGTSNSSFSKNADNNKTIVVNAKYSNVVMQ
ncbi:hypothetical protein [Winogradskyella immobilis]|uniref:Adhesin domain-containing protein n=1 Tax=Winogradskyella immobilis TaxID=2816852 RepID=A0ABS8EQC4_9FLAO|nr:hypothetical protein [Winogradskyella immobilis]MCC1485433.1 hypothetical protein [Winogradskyella immobilis]MCG0017525.1 hypothetical protein [Winogradskyella immobilis]